MKKTLCFIFVIMLASSLLFAQKNGGESIQPKNNNIFKFGVFNFFNSTLLAAFEHQNERNTGFEFLASVMSKSYNNGYNYGYGNNSERLFNYHFELQYRYYPIKEFHETNSDNRFKFQHETQIYFAPYLYDEYLTLDATYNTGGYNYPPVYNTVHKHYYQNAMSGGILFGINFIMLKKINLDLFTGGGFRSSTQDNFDNYYNQYSHYSHGGIYGISFSGIMIRGGIHLGFVL